MGGALCSFSKKPAPSASAPAPAPKPPAENISPPPAPKKEAAPTQAAAPPAEPKPKSKPPVPVEKKEPDQKPVEKKEPLPLPEKKDDPIVKEVEQPPKETPQEVKEAPQPDLPKNEPTTEKEAAQPAPQKQDVDSHQVVTQPIADATEKPIEKPQPEHESEPKPVPEETPAEPAKEPTNSAENPTEHLNGEEEEEKPQAADDANHELNAAGNDEDYPVDSFEMRSPKNDEVAEKKEPAKPAENVFPQASSFLMDPCPQDDAFHKVKTHVICTLGPKTSTEEAVARLIDAGMSIVRMNFSHGDHAYHGNVLKNVRSCIQNTGKVVAIMLDTKGPEIRTGKLTSKEAHLEAGQVFTFLTDESVIGDNTQVSTTYKSLPKTVQEGQIILVDDGLISFTVLNIEEDKVTCRVNNSAVLGETKGVNLPNCTVDLPSVTEKDISDIEFGVQMGVDMIACSFIRKASDIETIRNLPGVLEKNILLIAKIESQEGLDNFDSILQVADGIMVARGDLGVEVPIEKVCNIQKMIIAKCNKVGKPVITATQMLESMTFNPRPTRAEATDVANAIFDGTDCVMLSGETAKGAYPTESIRMMLDISRSAEEAINYRDLFMKIRKNTVPPISISETTASSAVKTSWDLNAKLLVVLTETGASAKLISKYRPHCPIICVTRDENVARRLLLYRGCYPYVTTHFEGGDATFDHIIGKLREREFCEPGDLIVLISGTLHGVPGSTNTVKVAQVSS